MQPCPGPTGDYLADVEDSSNEASQPQDEVAEQTDFKTAKKDQFDILWWWKEHAKMFPKMAIIVRNVSTIPTSNTVSERHFFSAGFVIQERKTQPTPGTVDNILFLQSNFQPNGNQSIYIASVCAINYLSINARDSEVRDARVNFYNWLQLTEM